MAQRLRRAIAAFAFAASIAVLPAQSAQTTQYTYDALGRVVSAIDANGKKVAYTYDSAGNRTRVSNGAEFTEITPSAFSASSNAGTTGLTASNGMKDGDFNALASIHATNTESNAWVMADLGSAQAVNHIDVAPALNSSVGASPADLDGTVIEYSTDNSHWSTAATINGAAPGATRTVAIGGVSLRYLRIRRTLSGQVAIGDLRLFSAAVANSPLIAQPDSIASSGAAVTFDPRTNDQDLDGYSFTISSVEDPPHGTAVVNSGASITYTPDPGYFGADRFLYSVADGHNGAANAAVTVLVRPSTNHAPVAVDDNMVVSDRVTSGVDGTNNLRPADNDYDSDGDVLTITAKTNPSHGTATIVGSSIIQYQPTASYSGSDSFTYTISDGRGGTDTGSVTLTVGNSNPVAGADNVSTARSQAVTFDPRLNDRDPNGDSLTVGSVTTPGKGTATLNGDQTITYTPAAGAVGADNFTYALSDGRGGTATGSVTVTVSPNSAPVARGDNIAAAGSAVTFDPRANDLDADNDPLTVVSLGTAGHGTVSIGGAGTSVTYTPSGGYTGVDSFTYTVSDSQGATGTATVAVNSLNVEYLIVGGGGGGDRGGGGGGGVLQGVSILPTGSLAVTVGAGGAANGGNGGASTFNALSASGGSGGGPSNGGPSPAYSGGTSSGVAVGGGGGAKEPGANGSGSKSGRGGGGVQSDINGTLTDYASGGGGGGFYVDGPPSAEADAGAAGGPSAGAGDGSATPVNRGGGGGGGHDGDTTTSGKAGGSGVVILRYLGVPKATGGTITQVGGYTIHTFTAGGTFAVTATNTPPTAANDTLGVVTSKPRVFDPRANDSDADGDALVVTNVTTPAHGVAVLNRSGAPVTYTPTAGYTGSDSFTYTISDGGASATATVNITVAAGASVEYLVVGGGGGGGAEQTYRGGGGGGGGVRSGSIGLPSAAYAIVVGGGGSGGIGSTSPTNGADSTFAGITALGGGAGAQGNAVGKSGGSGGGGSNGPGGAGLADQGNNGGASNNLGIGASGGGGGAAAVGVGAPSPTQAGAGGEGVASSIDGTSRIYGSGGGGGGLYSYTVAGVGGTNAGSGSVSSAGGSGTANRGGGGGGGGYNGTAYNGGAGGSGIVIIRYPTGSITGATGGTVTTSGGYTIHTFTSSGTFTVP